MRFLKNFAKIILKEEIQQLDSEINNLQEDLHRTEDSGNAIKLKLEKKIKKLTNPENILLKYYRIDNIGSDGLPPSYLNPSDKNEYTQRLSELESIYRNKAFREMMAWSLNFHANLLAVGKIETKEGDVIEIPASKAQDMINGIKAIWELVMAAHNKDSELTGKVIDPYEIEHDILDELKEG